MASKKSSSVSPVVKDIFPPLGLSVQGVNAGAFWGQWGGSGPVLEKRTPIDGSVIGRVAQAAPADYERAVAAAEKAFAAWRDLPAPKRGEVIRRYGEALRALKTPLGRLVSLEAGKILAEGEGEVQEMIDICDYAVGLSRQLYGLTIASERPGHHMRETWHPLGVVGIISAFNFPVAVWCWNSAIAAACGDTTIWKPSEKTPLTAIACIRIAEKVCRKCGVDPAIFALVIGDGPAVGELMTNDRRVPLVSATGSTRMGRRVGEVVAKRFGRSILELGGNNAIIVAPSADLKMAKRGILFGAVGTAGQRCTTTRRIIVHESVKEQLVKSLVDAYKQVPIGNPLESGTLMGPLIDRAAVEAYRAALDEVRKEGGRILCGGKVLDRPGYFVEPTIVRADPHWHIVQRETFAPILYVMSFQTIDEAIQMQNDVPQGLSSAIFSNNLRHGEQFISAAGSDCGIANINIGTSGAEIGGAFGGEKDTGGGREAGSDAWKAYMRRQTNTVNWGTDLPLAQGIKFGS